MNKCNLPAPEVRLKREKLFYNYARHLEKHGIRTGTLKITWFC